MIESNNLDSFFKSKIFTHAITVKDGLLASGFKSFSDFIFDQIKSRQKIP